MKSGEKFMNFSCSWWKTDLLYETMWMMIECRLQNTYCEITLLTYRQSHVDVFEWTSTEFPISMIAKSVLDFIIIAPDKVLIDFVWLPVIHVIDYGIIIVNE